MSEPKRKYFHLYSTERRTKAMLPRAFEFYVIAVRGSYCMSCAQNAEREREWEHNISMSDKKMEWRERKIVKFGFSELGMKLFIRFRFINLGGCILFQS